MVYSLAMSFERNEDGTWTVAAEWLPEPVTAPSYAEAYWEALARRTAASG